MANVMTMKKLQNKTSRNGFDLSRKNIFSAKIGELLPVACVECIPGDSFNIKTQHFTRTRPVNTAAFTRIREYYDWFFVPSNLLWNKFNTFVSQMGNNNQQAQAINQASQVTDQHPYFSRRDIASYLTGLDMDVTTKSNIFGFNRALNTAKLLEYLDYGKWLKTSNTFCEPSYFLDDVALNPFPLLAYQKIYSDYFRHSQWENAYAPSFNINYMQGSDMKIPVTNIDRFNSPYTMFDLQYCNWHKDYFMGLLPNSQYGDAASVNISSLVDDTRIFTPTHSATPSTQPYLNADGQLITSSNGFWELQGYDKGKLIGAFSILALRNAEAMQKWAEITQSQQQDYQSQVDAHFGVKVSDAYSERCTWISGGNSTIDISEVINNNITGENIADVAGKGVGTGDDFCTFETKVHGYLMCIYHAVPLLDYSLSGIPRMNLKTMATDYAIPEFDKTGMVAVPLQELYSKQYNRDESTNLPDLLGYAPRYYDYKVSYDKINGAFNFGDGFGTWVAPVSSEYLREMILKTSVPSEGTLSIGFSFFKVNPAFMNPIFDLSAAAGDSVTSDQLLINTYIDLKAVRNLDRDGLPY